MENKATDFPRFIVIESIEDVCVAKFFPFLIEKVIATKTTFQDIKKTRNRNLLVEVDSRRPAKNFHTTKYQVYPHERLNTSKGVIRSRELALATEEMIAALGKRGVTNIRRLVVRKDEEQIKTKTYIQNFY